MCRLLLVWAWTEWIVAGKCLVDPPPSPALRRSWGKVLVCHKGLGGVFCVSGPRVCQPKALGLVYQLKNLWVQLAFSVIPGWTTPVVLWGQVTLQPSFLVFSSPSFTSGAPPSLRPVSPPHSPSSILLPSLPIFFFCPFTPYRLSS